MFNVRWVNVFVCGVVAVGDGYLYGNVGIVKCVGVLKC